MIGEVLHLNTIDVIRIISTGKQIYGGAQYMRRTLTVTDNNFYYKISRHKNGY